MGFYLDSIQLGDHTGRKWNADPKIIIMDLKEGEEGNKFAWYADPHAQCSVGGKAFKGTFRSPECNKVEDLSLTTRGMCVNCSAIGRMESFRKRIKARSKSEGPRDTTHIRHGYLNREEALKKMRQLKSRVDMQESKLFFAKSKIAQLQIRLRSYKERLQELSRRGSMKAIGMQLQKAASEDILQENSFMHDFLSTFSRNLHVKNKARDSSLLRNRCTKYCCI